MRSASTTSILALLIAALGLALVFGCEEEDSDTDEGFDCDRGYELVFEAGALWGQTDVTYRFWLNENDDNFLAGLAQDLSTGKEYPTIGDSKGEGEMSVTFSPGALYLESECHKPLSITLDLKDFAGTLTVYCDLTAFDQSATEAVVECDETGISL